jgi:hypothetical protein
MPQYLPVRIWSFHQLLITSQATTLMSGIYFFIITSSFSFSSCDIQSFLFRIREFENNEMITPAANDYIVTATNSNTEDPNITPVQQSEVGRSDLLDVNNPEYNLSPSDYATSNAVQPDSTAQTYLQDNRQMQNISPLSSFMVDAHFLSWFI